MSKRSITFFVLAFFSMIGYNVFLAHRDTKLYEAYNQPTPYEKHCEQLKTWHPDCKLE